MLDSYGPCGGIVGGRPRQLGGKPLRAAFWPVCARIAIARYTVERPQHFPCSRRHLTTQLVRLVASKTVPFPAGGYDDSCHRRGVRLGGRNLLLLFDIRWARAKRLFLAE